MSGGCGADVTVATFSSQCLRPRAACRVREWASQVPPEQEVPPPHTTHPLMMSSALGAWGSVAGQDVRKAVSDWWLGPPITGTGPPVGGGGGLAGRGGVGAGRRCVGQRPKPSAPLRDMQRICILSHHRG